LSKEARTVFIAASMHQHPKRAVGERRAINRFEPSWPDEYRLRVRRGVHRLRSVQLETRKAGARIFGHGEGHDPPRTRGFRRPIHNPLRPYSRPVISGVAGAGANSSGAIAAPGEPFVTIW